MFGFRVVGRKIENVAGGKDSILNVDPEPDPEPEPPMVVKVPGG